MNALVDYWLAGGPLMIPLAVLCFAMWLCIVVLYPKLQSATTAASGVPELLHGLRAESVTLRVKEWAAAHPGPVARVAEYATSAGLEPGMIRDRLAEGRLAEIPPFQHELTILKAMVAAAPLLGLLGTVKGMIATFSVLSTRGTASMELLSAGISEALVTTQVGLVVALPGLVGAYAISRRLAGLEAAFDCLESHLLASTAQHRAQPESGTKGDTS